MSQSSEQNNPATQDTMSRSNGRVKWFNNKHGYGFLTCGSGDKKDEDVFVHHTALTTSEEQYRYLVQGEYVEFTLKESENSDHPYQADDISGICGGKLMCETRWEVRQQREAEMADSGDGDETTQRRSRRRVRPRGSGPRDDSGWSSSSGKRRAPKRVSQSSE